MEGLNYFLQGYIHWHTSLICNLISSGLANLGFTSISNQTGFNQMAEYWKLTSLQHVIVLRRSEQTLY